LEFLAFHILRRVRLRNLGKFVMAIAAAVIFEIIVLKIADWTAPYMEKYFELEGVSVPTGSTCSYAPIGIPLIWLIQKIPVIKDLKADPDYIQQKVRHIRRTDFYGLSSRLRTGWSCRLCARRNCQSRYVYGGRYGSYAPYG
jgi:Phosphotransferase system, galactitol-specific IIC component